MIELVLLVSLYRQSDYQNTMNNQETTPETPTFSEAARQAYTQRADQLDRESVTKHEQTFDAQRAKLRFALAAMFGDVPEYTDGNQIQFDITPDEETGEYSPKIEIDGNAFIAKRFPNGALLAMETKCPQTGEIIQTPISSMADVGKILSDPPLSPVAKAFKRPSLDEVRSRAIAALNNAAPQDKMTPIMFWQALSTDFSAQTMEGIQSTLSDIAGQLVDINQAISDQVYAAPGDEETPEINLEDKEQWQIGIREHKAGSLEVSLYSVKDNLDSDYFYFLLDGRQLLYSDDERAPQWVFDSVREHLKDN